jgi:formylglycine-generating enzyme required for sulfatase activity
MIIDKMMAKRLDQRYQTMEEVIRDIEAFQGGATISYKIKKKKKFPVKRVVAAVLIIFVAMIAFFQWQKSQISGEERTARDLLNEAKDIWSDGAGDLADALQKVEESVAVFTTNEATAFKNELKAENTYREGFAAGKKDFEAGQWSRAVASFNEAYQAKQTDEALEFRERASFENAMALGKDHEDSGRWGDAINQYNTAIGYARSAGDTQRAKDARSRTEAKETEERFATHISNAKVALSKGEIADADKEVLEASKIFADRDEVRNLEAEIEVRKKTAAKEAEFRENYENGKTKLGNEEFAQAINFFTFAKGILEETPALQAVLTEETADLEKRLNSAKFGKKMVDGREAQAKSRHWEALDRYKEAMTFANVPQKANAVDAIYKLAMSVAVPAWAERKTKDADRAVKEALAVRPEDSRAIALKAEIDRFGKTPAGMVYVPGGEFMAGSEDVIEAKENPRRKVTVAPFYMDSQEVTNKQFLEFDNDGGYEKQEYWDEEGWSMREERFRVMDDSALGPRSWSSAGEYGGQRYDDYPVVGISWYEAKAYAEWKGKRLPTDEEWEFAAGYDPVEKKKRLYPWGDNWDVEKGNFRSAREPVPISVFKATDVSPWGCFNMGGNVSEWCVTAEGGPSYRGGSFRSGDLYSKARINLVKHPVARARPPDGGFRCAMDAR